MVVNDSIYYEHYIRSGYSTTLRYSYNRVESIYKVIDKKFDLLSTLGFTYDDIALNEWLLLDCLLYTSRCV